MGIYFQFLDVFISFCGILLAFVVYKKEFQKKCKCEQVIGLCFNEKTMKEVYGITVKVINTGNLPVGLSEISVRFGRINGISLVIFNEGKRLDIGESHVSSFAPTKEQYKAILSKVKNKDERITICIKTTIKTYKIKTDKTVSVIEKELGI